MNTNNPIGIFDSGIGGLTVFAAIRKELVNESLIYLGDTARVPYGNKSAETIIRYSKECAQFLVDRGVKAIVVACNTATAFALPEISRSFDIPIIGVVEPGARAAIRRSKNHTIGVIGTAGTIGSNAYGAALKNINRNVRVVSRACPIFVPLVEEGWLDNDVAEAAIARYLSGMKDEGVDTLILGCTHYPLIAGTIQKVLGDGIQLVDSAATTAEELSAMLAKQNLAAEANAPASSHIYVTDLPTRFESIAQRFLKCEPPPVTRVDL